MRDQRAERTQARVFERIDQLESPGRFGRRTANQRHDRIAVGHIVVERVRYRLGDFGSRGIGPEIEDVIDFDRAICFLSKRK